MNGDATANRALTSLEHSTNPVVIVIDEERDSNRNFIANIFVIPCGDSASTSGPISLNSGDVGSLVLEIDDSDPESVCTCTIECWVHETDAQNRPKTKVTLCPRCSERAKRRRETTLSVAVSRNSTGNGSSVASTSSSSMARENINVPADVEKRGIPNYHQTAENDKQAQKIVSHTSMLRSKFLQRRKQQCMRRRSFGAFKCLKCRKVMPTSDQLKNHLKQHNESIHYPCPHCSCIFRLRNSAALHILREHSVKSH